MNRDDDPPSVSSSAPFWRGWNVGRLMVLMVPIALYCATFAAVEPPDPREPRSPAGDLLEYWPLAVALATVAISGIVVSVLRRATFREAIVQWCVPPAFFVVLWTMILAFSPSVIILFASLGIGLSLGTLLNRFCIWRGERNVPWPEDWLGDSILWGFAHLGIMMLTMFLFTCCLAGFFA